MVPEKLRKLVLSLCHDSLIAGHYGVLKTTQKLTLYFNWRGMRQDVKDYVKSCTICQRIKPRNRRPYGFYTAKPEKGPGYEYAIDLFGPLPRSKGGNKYCVIISDTFSRYIECFPMKESKTGTIFPHFFNFCSRNGFPNSIRHDMGPQFTSDFWGFCLKKLEIKIKFSEPWRPQGNPVERQIKEVKGRIKAFAERHDEWDKHLEIICFAIRGCVNATTGFTPNFLHFGREMRDPLIVLPQVPTPDTNSPKDAKEALGNRMKAFQVAIENTFLAKQQQAAQYNKSRIPHPFQVGNLVLKDLHRLSDAAKKFAAGLAPLRAPTIYKIESQIGPNAFILKDMESNNRTSANVDQITLFTSRPPHLR
jgi:hypothetical protein